MIAYARYTPEFRSRVVELLNHHWSWSDLARSSAFFEWRYENNPYTDTPCVFMAMDGARLAGLRCYVVQRFQRSEDTILMACPADAFVHADYRRMGIYGALTELSFDEGIAPGVAVVLSLSANRTSAAGNRKLGMEEFGRQQYLYRFCLREALGLRRNGPAKTVSGTGASIEIVQTNHPSTPPRCRYPATGGKFSNVRDEAWYAWRFREPSAEFYYLGLDDADSRSYLILKRLGTRSFALMEYGFDTVEVFRAAISAFHEYSGGIVYRLLDITLDKDDVSRLLASGFRYEPRMLVRLLNKYRGSALVRLVNLDNGEPGRVLARKDVFGTDKWHIVSADVH